MYCSRNRVLTRWLDVQVKELSKVELSWQVRWKPDEQTKDTSKLSLFFKTRGYKVPCWSILILEDLIVDFMATVLVTVFTTIYQTVIRGLEIVDIAK